MTTAAQPLHQVQLTAEEYAAYSDRLGPQARKALKDAAHGYVQASKTVRAALARKGLIRPDESLTPNGKRLRAALVAPPGSLAHRVAQVLIDGGLTWRELPGGQPLRGGFSFAHTSKVSVHVLCRNYNDTPSHEVRSRAEHVLQTCGFAIRRLREPGSIAVTPRERAAKLAEASAIVQQRTPTP